MDLNITFKRGKSLSAIFTRIENYNLNEAFSSPTLCGAVMTFAHSIFSVVLAPAFFGEYF